MIWPCQLPCHSRVFKIIPRPSLGEQLYGAADARTLRQCWISGWETPDFFRFLEAIFGLPIYSMYSIFTYIWAICGVNVGKYSIHGAYGLGKNDELSHRERAESYQPSSRMKLGWYGMTWRCPFPHEATASYHPVVMDENDDWYWKPWWLGDPPF